MAEASARWRGVARAGAFVLVAALAAAALPGLARPGYSPDEEFTVFAVRGISAHGLPILPSGLLYDRGLMYSYLAWVARVVSGHELAGARALSLAFAIGALAALWIAVRRAAGELAALLAVALLASSVPFWVAATTARFYAPFLALHLAGVAVLAGAAGAPAWRLRRRDAALLAGLAALARLAHELAFVLAAIPLACAVLASPGRRRPWLWAAAAVAAGLSAAQAALFALHFVAPESGATMIRRFFLWQVLNLLERPPLAVPLGAGLVVLLFLLLIGRLRPVSRLRGRAAAVAIAAGAGAAAWAAVSSRALDYPLDLFWEVAGLHPLLVAALLMLLGARAWGLGGAWRPVERAAHLLWLGWVVFFGVIESGITMHYLLAPVAFMLAAIAVDAAAVIGHRAPAARGPVTAALLAALGVAVVLPAWGWRPSFALQQARPTITPPAGLREIAAEAPLVACTDELACLLLAGRADRWLALDDFLRRRFVIRRGGADVGVYAGRPAVYDLASLLKGEAASARAVVIDVAKDLPVGSSAAFLDRAVAVEPVRGRVLLQEGRVRAIEIASTR